MIYNNPVSYWSEQTSVSLAWEMCSSHWTSSLYAANLTETLKEEKNTIKSVQEDFACVYFSDHKIERTMIQIIVID